MEQALAHLQGLPVDDQKLDIANMLAVGGLDAVDQRHRDQQQIVMGRPDLADQARHTVLRDRERDAGMRFERERAAVGAFLDLGISLPQQRGGIAAIIGRSQGGPQAGRNESGGTQHYSHGILMSKAEFGQQ
ncbi:hypothetical protein GCM10007881_03470 [Mesorhizobium huakuii]|nr:hypothetical protein GCM10007881_03470 [Mesorhizobium huakuii]